MLNELNEIDTNCNNCVFMERDMDKYKESVLLQRKNQDDYVANKRKNMIAKATAWEQASNRIVNSNPKLCEELYNKAQNIRLEASKINPNYKKPKLSYGTCIWKSIKLSKWYLWRKKVSFIPQVCMPENNKCWKSR